MHLVFSTPFCLCLCLFLSWLAGGWKKGKLLLLVGGKYKHVCSIMRSFFPFVFF